MTKIETLKLMESYQQNFDSQSNFKKIKNLECFLSNERIDEGTSISDYFFLQSTVPITIHIPQENAH